MERDRHEFIRHMYLMEEMEKNQDKKEEKKTNCPAQGGGWPAGVRLIPEDCDEW